MIDLREVKQVIGTAIHAMRTAAMLHEENCTCALCVQSKKLAALYTDLTKQLPR